MTDTPVPAPAFTDADGVPAVAPTWTPPPAGNYAPPPVDAPPVPVDGIPTLDYDVRPTFQFRLPGDTSGKVWSLPHLEDLPLGIRTRLGEAANAVDSAKRANREPTDAQLEALGRAQLDLLNDFAPGLTDRMPIRALAALLAAWNEHAAANGGGVSLGESRPSAG